MKKSTTTADDKAQGFGGVATPSRQHAPPSTLAPVDAVKERTVICSPHFDDAVLSCWSSLARDPGSTVVNVFTGAPRSDLTYWYDQVNGAASSALHMQERAEEDRHALSMAGKSAIDLGLLERQYRLRPSPWLHQLFRRASLLRFVLLRLPFLDSTLHSVAPPDVDRMADAILAAVPDATSIWVPAGIGGHTDHLLVREAGRVLAARGFQVFLYADLPYVLRFGWPRWLKGADGQRAMDRASSYWASHFSGWASPQHVTQQAQYVCLTATERADKAEAIRRYVSQFDATRAARVVRWLRQPDAFDYEVFWPLNSLNQQAAQRR